jgi:hypothetical protein
MRNATTAERILSLVTTRDRAAATVGDLIESRAGALRFWFTIGSQVLRRAAVPAVVGFLAQFFLFFWVGFALRFSVYLFIRPFTLLRWIVDITLLSTQLLAGYGIARYGKTRALGICVIVVLTDCVLGALRINNGNINMAVWAIPLLASTLATRRSVRPAPSPRPS